MKFSSGFAFSVLSYSLVFVFGYVHSWTLNTIILSIPKLGSVQNVITDSSQAQLIESVSVGVTKGLDECKHQFKWNLWNCPETAESVLGRNKVTQANKETAFVQAIVAAGVMYQVTKSCSSANQSFCSCVKVPREKPGDDWTWGGCSDNFDFGEKISRHIFKYKDKSRGRLASVQLHNRQVGHKAVIREMLYRCKCHGICGSCTVRTCWKQLGDFRYVGEFLRRRYQNAVRTQSDDTQGRGNRARNIQLPKVSKRDLVYIEDAPNYCALENPYGYKATIGRECIRPRKKAPKWERNSCRSICKKCGRRTRKVVMQVPDKCDCKFKWCCVVECAECVKRVTKYFCK